MHLDRMRRFYSECFALRTAETTEAYCVLESDGWTLWLVVVPDEVAATIQRKGTSFSCKSLWPARPRHARRLPSRIVRRAVLGRGEMSDGRRSWEPPANSGSRRLRSGRCRR
jgi:hypothetical protein